VDCQSIQHPLRLETRPTTNKTQTLTNQLHRQFFDDKLPPLSKISRYFLRNNQSTGSLEIIALSTKKISQEDNKQPIHSHDITIIQTITPANRVERYHRLFDQEIFKVVSPNQR